MTLAASRGVVVVDAPLLPIQHVHGGRPDAVVVQRRLHQSLVPLPPLGGAVLVAGGLAEAGLRPDLGRRPAPSLGVGVAVERRVRQAVGLRDRDGSKFD